MELTPNELKQIAAHPDALRALAELHDVHETEADAVDMPDSADYHKKRAAELRAEADRINKAWTEA